MYLWTFIYTFMYNFEKFSDFDSSFFDWKRFILVMVPLQSLLKFKSGTFAYLLFLDFHITKKF